jgi:hypothetical protein
MISLSSDLAGEAEDGGCDGLNSRLGPVATTCRGLDCFRELQESQGMTYHPYQVMMYFARATVMLSRALPASAALINR